MRHDLIRKTELSMREKSDGWVDGSRPSRQQTVNNFLRLCVSSFFPHEHRTHTTSTYMCKPVDVCTFAFYSAKKNFWMEQNFLPEKGIWEKRVSGTASVRIESNLIRRFEHSNRNYDDIVHSSTHFTHSLSFRFSATVLVFVSIWCIGWRAFAILNDFTSSIRSARRTAKFSPLCVGCCCAWQRLCMPFALFRHKLAKDDAKLFFLSKQWWKKSFIRFHHFPFEYTLTDYYLQWHRKIVKNEKFSMWHQSTKQEALKLVSKILTDFIVIKIR